MRNEDLVWPGHRGDPRPDVHGDPGELLPDALALSGMHPGPDGQSQRANRRDDLLRASHRASRPLEATDDLASIPASK